MSSEMSGDDGGEAPTREAEAAKALSTLEKSNLCFSLLAWACMISNVTLVVGTSAVVALSVGGDENIASMPLGSFFFGSAVVSFTITPWLFRQWGRKVGFITGIAFGLLGSALGALSVVYESPALLVVASFFFGMAMGIGYFLRFAAVELVPASWAARAVTLVVSGGCLAAFAGPESARATKDSFGDDLEYLGVFIMTGVFNLLNLVFTMLIRFPKEALSSTSASSRTPTEETPNQATLVAEEEGLSSMDGLPVGLPEEQEQQQQRQQQQIPLAEQKQPTLGSLIQSRNFIVPMLIAGLTWAIMALPMSLVRVAMNQTGFTSRQSLTVIELHFLSMYGPGFVTGDLIHAYGPRRMCSAAAVLFAGALACVLLAEEESDSEHSMALWTIGLMLVGVGWNAGFTGATVWITALYKQAPERKAQVQSANDGLMFLFAGAWIVSASYIYEAGGSFLDGWRTLNLVVVGLVGVYVVVLVTDVVLERLQSSASPRSHGRSTESQTLPDASRTEES